MLVCPRCGHDNPLDRVRCDECLARLTASAREAVPSEKRTATEELYRNAAEDLAEGRSKEEVVTKLVWQGMDRHDAIQFVDQTQEALNQYREEPEEALNQYKRLPEARRIMAGKYARHMLFGALWVIGGTIVTLWTYNAAGPGETYVVAWGAIAFGAIDFLWGLFNWLRYSI